MKTLLYCSLLLLALSCKKDPSDIVDPEHDTVLAEYPDWYILKAPVDKEILGVWGDRDKTLLISTGYAVFRSTDKGSHWQQVLPQQSIGIFGVVQNQDTLFTMSGLANQSAGETYRQVMIHPNNYSLDDGVTWQPYNRRNPIFDIPTSNVVDKRLLINPVASSTDTRYKVNQVFLDGPKATSGNYETPGVITDAGHRIDLPQLHQIQSLYLDSQQRLYVACTDAVCGRGGITGEPFSFCNSKQGRGVVYISKHPLP